MNGKLYICGTPIGNLEDVTIRLLKTLRKVDLIACEDTRHTIKLLNRYKIKTKLFSYHEHSSRRREQFLLDELTNGRSIALVSDAGMPTISDPGENLIRRAIEGGIEIEVVPGPSAFTAALAVAGIDSSSFVFAGFLPPKQGKRMSALSLLDRELRTVILYEAPHRLLKTLEDIETVMGNERLVIVARELTKVHQEVRHGTVKEVRDYYQQNQPRGEICLLLPVRDQEGSEVSIDQIVKETEDLINNGVNKKQALKMKAREHNISKSTLYALLINSDDMNY